MMAGLLQFMGLGHLAAENFQKCKGGVPLKEQLQISSKKARFFSFWELCVLSHYIIIHRLNLKCCLPSAMERL